MREGSLEAPIRHVIDWQNPDFYDEAKLDDELRRVFDICHGCRRCFNLCDSFPRLFDLIDESDTGELDSVQSQDFGPVIDACTLCDMCFMVKCPYVPPHEFDLDFPHLMLRARAIEYKKGQTSWAEQQLTDTDRNGKLATGALSGLANWATDRKNGVTRGMLESVAGVAKDAALPRYAAKTLEQRAKEAPPVAENGPAAGRKAVVYATCQANFNAPETGLAALQVLHKNGVETEVLHPACCGMPQLEHGDLASVAARAKQVAQSFKPWIEKGYDVIALTPSCALMLKFEWPLIVPDDPDVKALSEASFDISEYIVTLAKGPGMAEGLEPLDGGVSLHIACHSRAQNMGQKAAEMLRLIPDADLKVIERCSGHGGSWGVMKENFETGMKVGKPVMRQAVQADMRYVSSECPLAGLQIHQGMERLAEDKPVKAKLVGHPVELIARSYGFAKD